MSAFLDLTDLAAERLGGSALLANDEFFAPKENLLKASKPVFAEGKYTDRGKWMDGWETRRRRTPGHDWCVIRLGLPGLIRGVVIDTSHFTGNYPEHASLDAATLAGELDGAEFEALSPRWTEILPRSALRGDSPNLFSIDVPRRFTHVRLNVFPDGGVARLRIHGEVVPEPSVFAGGGFIDLAGLENGGSVLAASDTFFSPRHHLILPGPATGMSDGWETRRRRGPGHDWVILALGATGTIRRVEVDTSHFKGNAPGSCSLEACRAEGAAIEEITSASRSWSEVLPRAALEPHAFRMLDREIRPAGPVTHVRFNIYPDGGVSRLRILGTVDGEGRSRASLRHLNALPDDEARARLIECCGSAEWAESVAAARPFASVESLDEAAERIWWQLDPAHWLEAFRCHPRIGEKAEPHASGAAARWSEDEQAGAARASRDARRTLVEANRAYESRFGFLFIVCASGKSAEEMLAILEGRLQNDRDRELRVAAAEQLAITRLRLEKLFLA